MQASADRLLERFVEVQAQQLSHAVTRRMETTDWLQCPPPKEVTHLVSAILAELRSMQTLAALILPSDSPATRPALLPQGAFPIASTPSALGGGGRGGGTPGAGAGAGPATAPMPSKRTCSACLRGRSRSRPAPLEEGAEGAEEGAAEGAARCLWRRC